MSSPYEGLQPQAFWRTGVCNQNAGRIEDLYRPKFTIDRSTRIATAGSCFAQHIARHLRMRGFAVMDEEPPPADLDENVAQRFGYGLYSARYGNIYCARQLRQLAEEAWNEFAPADAIWEKDGRYYDAMRPAVEPNGLSSVAAVRNHRAHHLRKVRRVLKTANVIIFTLGLTEAWEHEPSGTVYPTAPGTIAGEYNPAVHRFRNFTFREIYRDLKRFFNACKSKNPDMRFLLSVSPVPLTATASGDHVLCASTYSKSVLRAVAGQLKQDREDVDYIPSYEIITGPLARAAYFEDNLRNIRPAGVEAAMNMFFANYEAAVETFQPAPTLIQESEVLTDHGFDDDVQCEEALLEAFAS